jgi:hypothetical protein
MTSPSGFDRLMDSSLRETSPAIGITCLHWDSDGALNQQDREWMLQELAAKDPLGVILIPWNHQDLP